MNRHRGRRSPLAVASMGQRNFRDPVNEPSGAGQACGPGPRRPNGEGILNRHFDDAPVLAVAADYRRRTTRHAPWAGAAFLATERRGTPFGARGGCSQPPRNPPRPRRRPRRTMLLCCQGAGADWTRQRSATRGGGQAPGRSRPARRVVGRRSTGRSSNSPVRGVGRFVGSDRRRSRVGGQVVAAAGRRCLKASRAT